MKLLSFVLLYSAWSVSGAIGHVNNFTSRLAVEQCAVQDAACFCTAVGGAGTYREPTKCSGWYQCTSAVAGFYFACPAGLLFDTSCSCCTWPSQVQCLESETPQAFPMPTLSSSPPACTHTVRSGDTYYKLAEATGTTVDAIQVLNSGVDANKLEIGQVLKFPCPDSPASGWHPAWQTVYSSYPCCCKKKPPKGCDTLECEDYSGCEYQGLFEALDGKKSKAWVKSNRIAAFFARENASVQYGDVRLRRLLVRNPAKPSKVLKLNVVDTCADSDCDGCCMENSSQPGSGGVLIDLEYWTAVALHGSVPGNDFQLIEWQLAA